MKRFRFAVAAFALLAVVAASSAPAQTKYASSVKITSIDAPTGADPMKWHGKVSSSKGKCKRGRKVVVFQRLDGPDAHIGSTHSHRKGRWNFAFQLNPSNGDLYYAKVRSKSIGSGACKAATSKDFTFNF